MLTCSLQWLHFYINHLTPQKLVDSFQVTLQEDPYNRMKNTIKLTSPVKNLTIAFVNTLIMITLVKALKYKNAILDQILVVQTKFCAQELWSVIQQQIQQHQQQQLQQQPENQQC